MKNIEDIVLIIQARTQSTRIPNKMLKPFADSCLFEIAIQKVIDSKIPKKNILLSIMDQELIDIANKYGMQYFHRSEESTREPITLQKVFEWHNAIPFEHYVILNACNPLLKVSTINAFIDAFCLSNSNGLFGVLKKVSFFYDASHHMINAFYGSDEHLATLETKMVEPVYEAAHTLYAGKTDDIAEGIYMGKFDFDGPEFFELDELECFDIDWPRQFEIAEKIYTLEKACEKSL